MMNNHEAAVSIDSTNQERITLTSAANDSDDGRVDVDDESSKGSQQALTSSVLKKSGNRRIRRTKEKAHVFPVEPRIIQVIKKPRTYVNHSYRDFSCVPAETDFEFPKNVWEMTFPEKVHHMLMQEAFNDWISWNPHGRSFSVRVPKKFEENVLPIYLGHKRYSSFLRQLANYGFRTLTRKGSELNSHYHECMLRGLPHLAKYMPKPKDARRQIPDPDCEPNFYEISRKYPLPDDPNFGKDNNLGEGRKRTQESNPASARSPKAETSVANHGLPSVVQSSDAARNLLQQPDTALVNLMAGSRSVSSVPQISIPSVATSGLCDLAAHTGLATSPPFRIVNQPVHFPVAYSVLGNVPGVAGFSSSVQPVVDPNSRALAAALRALGSGQSQMLPSTYTSSHLSGLFGQRSPFSGL